MKRHDWTIITCLALLLACPAAAYDDDDYEKPEDQPTVEFVTGYQGSSTDDAIHHVAEYEVVEPSPLLGLSFASSPFDRNRFSFSFDRLNSDQLSGEAGLDLGRMVRVTATLDGMLHRLDHDPLSNLQAVSAIKVVRSTDLEPDAEYQIRRRLYNVEAEFQHPDVKWFTWRAGLREEQRDGTKQSLSTSHCTSCHTVSQGRQIDRSTTDLSFGAHMARGRTDLDYEVSTRKFVEDGPAPTSFYEQAYRPAGVANPDDMLLPFGDRLWFQNGTYPANDIPELKRTSHKLKFRAGFRARDALNITVVQTRTENRNTMLEYEFSGYRARYTIEPAKKLRLNFFWNRDEIQNDSIFVDLPDLNGLTASPTSNYGGTVLSYEDWINTVARPGSSSNFTDYTRLSSMDRADDRLGTDLTWRPIRRGLLRAGYTYRLIDRDNVVLADGTGETTSHSIKLAWNQRFKKKVRWSNNLLYRTTDNPYVNVDGEARAYDPLNPGQSSTPKNPLSLQYFELHALRVADVTNVPTGELRIRSQATWSPGSVALSGSVRYRDVENDELDYSTWSQTSLGVGANLWVMASPKLQIMLGADHQRQETEAFVAVPLMDG